MQTISCDSVFVGQYVDNRKAIPNLFEMIVSVNFKLASNCSPGLYILAIKIVIKKNYVGRKVTLFDRTHRIIFWGNSMNDEAYNTKLIYDNFNCTR